MKCRIVLLERLYAALLVKKCIQNNEEEMEMKEMFKIDTAGENIVYTDTDLNVEFCVPANDCSGMKYTQEISPLNEKEDIKKAFLSPVSGKRLSEIAKERKSKTAAVLISDATRGIPNAVLAAHVIRELEEGGLKLKDITFFVAIGVHRPATEAEMKTALGDFYGKVKIENHTPFEKNNLIFLGKTSTGTPVSVNKRAYECDLHIQIGKVEPHEFAGFSGGRKSVLPGISSEETIHYNHRPEMIMDERATIGNLEDNPVNIDMIETAEWFRIDYGVNCILNNEMKLAAVFTGGMLESHSAAVNYVKKYLGVTVPKADIIVTTPGQPLDIDFYQALKAVIGLTGVLDNQVVLLYCGCKEGINSPDMLRAFSSSDNLDEVIKYTIDNYEIQMDHVLLTSKILKKNVKIVLCCPNVDDENAKICLCFQKKIQIKQCSLHIN